MYCRLTTAQLRMERGRAVAGGRAVGRGRGAAAPRHRVRGAGRSVEHPRLRRPVQPLPRPGEQRLRPPCRRVDGHGRRGLRRLRADREGGGRRRAARRARGHVATAGGAGRLVGPIRQHGGRLGRPGFPAGRRASRPTTWPPRCAPGTRRVRRPATWPSGAITPSSSARPRPMPWSSTPSWSIAIRWPPWRCWCSGSASPTKFPWSRRRIPSMTWRWTGWRSCGTRRGASPADGRRRRTAGR